ncbi:pentapeptide repeat-containing protein [Micromonospora sp. NPDC047465]|uniref:pentapeptide repeat-containing protein n=1 Tax=Micromonospora sp. NPDC047465 TaxID=3154813 RepID=UPI0033CA3C0B
MAVRAGRGGRWRAPAKPRPPSSLELATEDHDLENEATFRRLGFFDLDLSGRSADGVEFEQCRFKGSDLSGTQLDGAAFTDCLFESTNLANLRAEKSSMIRARLSTLRMTGVHWINGALRDVTVSECRLDLSSFRFTDFSSVVFEGCNLTRADFQNADLSGARFTNCDLTGAQFSQATMEGTRFANCVLVGIGGVTSMGGAVVAHQDLVALSYTLAGALGIRIEDAEAE